MPPIIGHSARFAALSRAFSKGQIPHTLLISGPPGVGKSLLVTRYAQLLLCPNLGEEDGLPAPCGVCKTCHQIEIEVFPDYRVFRPIISKAEETTAPETLDSAIFSIEQARGFIQESLKKPTNGPRKVLWLHQFEKSNEDSQNSLLKTLEEPPPGTFLVLTTENSRALRDTILSRCWHLPLPPVADSEIESWLRGRFSGAAPAEIREALRAAAGRPGAAFRELERLQKSGGEGEARSRFAIASEMLKRLDGASPVAALALTEEALSWANIWWAQDAGEGADLKKLGSKGPRAAAARFLDELMTAGRALWTSDLSKSGRNSANGAARNGIENGAASAVKESVAQSEIGAARLDQMRKTRQYILRNANRQLALEVMFGHLIAARGRRNLSASSPVNRPR